MTPPSRWLLATAVLFAGVSVLAAALRERGQVPARAAHAPRPEAAPAVEEPETPAGTAVAERLTPELARARLSRPGISGEEAREALRDAAARLDRTDARSLVLEALFDPAAALTMRMQALLLLPSVQEPGDAAALERLMGDRTFPARYLIAKTMGELSDPRATELLASWIRTEFDDSARIQAARALRSRAGEPAAAAALRDAALSDRNELVRQEALRAILDGGAPGAREFVREILSLASTPPSVRAVARGWRELHPGD